MLAPFLAALSLGIGLTLAAVFLAVRYFGEDATDDAAHDLPHGDVVRVPVARRGRG